MSSSSSSSSCLGRAAVPVKRVWRGLMSGRRRRRTTGKQLSSYVPVVNNPEEFHDDGTGAGGGVLAGLGRLRKEVRTCEYRDVHVMWEMLSSSSGNGGGSGRCDGSMGDVDDVVAADVAGKKGAPPATRRTRRSRRKPAPWSRLVAYCAGAF